ncbi:MAG: histidine kinase [Jatrophihabitantaceae bacterium]
MSAMTTAVDGLAGTALPVHAPRHRLAAPAAWSVAGIVPILSATALALHLHTGYTDLTSFWFGDIGLSVVLLVPGVLVALRRPDNAIGWLLCWASFSTGAAGAGGEYLAYGFLGGSAPGYLWIGWSTNSVYILSMGMLPLVLMLFPDGAMMPGRSRHLLILPIASMALGTFGSLFFADNKGVDVQGRRLYNPARQVFPSWLPDSAMSVSTLLFFASVITAIVLLVLRYRRSSGEVRLQMKWVVWAGTIGILELATEFIPNNTISPITGPIASSLLTASVCIAILRHRLFDIDVVINRTLVFVALTVLVVLLYAGLVAGFDSLAGQPVRLGSGLVATALVAFAFAPIRTRLQGGVDRLMFGDRKNPYGVMTQLGRRLERSGEHGELAVVVDTVSQALKLPYAAILDPDGLLLAESGLARGNPHLEPLSYQGAAVGQLVVEPRGAKAGFNRDERRLIADLARQIGAAVHAVRLSADLQASRQRLVSAKEEERRRLRRDLHDGLGPKLAALALKLDAARTMVDSKPVQSKAVLGEVKSDIRGTIEDIRQLVYGLRPPALDELGLVAALRECVQRFATGNDEGPAMTVHAPPELPQLPAAVEVAVYWIVNEAVTNVVRHASAPHCDVRLELAERAVLLTITDDGSGLADSWRAGVGTSSMAERAAELSGTLSIGTPRRARGTEVHVAIPVSAP